MIDNSPDNMRVALNIQISVCKALMQMIVDRYGFRVEKLNDQEFAVIQLFMEEIDIADSVACLIENKKTFGIETLTRSFVERYIYINAIISDPDMAKAYLLCSVIENLKSKQFKGKYHGLRSYVPDEIWKMLSGNINENKDIIEQIDKLYSGLFTDQKTKNIWYSLDGKTTTIEKLVKKLNLREFESYVYYLYSQEPHGRKIKYSLEEVLYTRTYPLIPKPEDFSLVSYLAGYLIQLRIILNDFLKLSPIK